MINRPRGVLAGGVVLLTLGTALPRLLPVPADLSRQLGDVRMAREAFAKNDDSTLERLRREAVVKENTAWTEERWRSWASDLGPRWRVRSGDAPGTVIIEREADHVSDWAPFTEAVRTWSRTPGLSVQAVEITATGPAGGRRFVKRVVSLRVQLATEATSPLPQNQTNQP